MAARRWTVDQQCFYYSDQTHLQSNSVDHRGYYDRRPLTPPFAAHAVSWWNTNFSSGSGNVLLGDANRRLANGT
jgi:hypothetical protein